MQEQLTQAEQEKIMSDALREKFTETVIYIFEEKPEIIEEYDRENRTNISEKRAVIKNEVNKKSGKMDKELKGFFDFVRKTIFDPMITELLSQTNQK